MALAVGRRIPLHPSRLSRIGNEVFKFSLSPDSFQLSLSIWLTDQSNGHMIDASTFFRRPKEQPEA